MASVEVSALSKAQKDELVMTYAALLLADGELEITVRPMSLTLQEEKLSKVIKASGNSVEAYWPALFAKALHGREISDILDKAGSAAAPVAAGGAAVVAPAAAKVEESKC